MIITGYMMAHSAFADILSRLSSGSTTDVVGKQGISQRSHKQVLETPLDSRFR